MRVKVLEALAAGKAIVATPLAVEGISVRDGVEVIVAQTASEFADAVVGLLRDPERRISIAAAARRWAEEHLDVEAEARAYETLYASLTGSTA
jgi:glycosyltransferase involved in cell wall biosynthesis